MDSIRESIINNGIVPIISLEGSKCLIDECIRSKIEGREYDTRRLELSSYKKPNDSSVATKEQLDEYAFRIVKLLINKLRKLSDLNDDRTVYDNLPTMYKEFSYEQFVQIFDLSDEKIIATIKKYNGVEKESFLNRLISNSIPNEDRIGKINAVPYGNDASHKKDADYRIYINTPNGTSRYDFLELFIRKCIDRNIPYEMKGEEHTNDEKDRTVIYCFDEYFDETIRVLEEIKYERPELISEFGSPIATALNYSYYAIATSRQGATYNYWINRISSHAINYLCANLIKADISYYSGLSDEEKCQIEYISNINNYSFDSEGRFSGASNRIVNDYIIEHKEKLMQPETCQKLVDSLKAMCSLANFRDLKHGNFPISLDSNFYHSFELTTQSIITEKKNEFNEAEQYLYHTEELLEGALQEFMTSELPNDQKGKQYVERVAAIEKNYRKYATHVPGFTGSERFKQIYEYLKIIPRFSLYEQDPTKGDFVNMQKEKMYYSEIANQITSYVDDSDHKKRLQ